MKIIFLGIQGSGKSTQAKLLSDKLALPYIEMGQLFRDKAKESNRQAQRIKETIGVGNLVPDEIAIQTLKARIASVDCQKGFILDGYPRNQAQLEALPADIDKVFYVQVSDGEAIRRLTARGRHDDNAQFIERRIAIFKEQTQPLLDHFKKMGILTAVDGGQTIEAVHGEILRRLDNGAYQN